MEVEEGDTNSQAEGVSILTSQSLFPRRSFSSLETPLSSKLGTFKLEFWDSQTCFWEYLNVLQCKKKCSPNEVSELEVSTGIQEK